MALADYQALVTSLVRDDTGKVTTTDRDRAIALAVTRYDRDRPRPKVEDMTIAAGGQLIALPAGWQDDVSSLVSLEYPVGRVPPAALGWRFYREPAALKLMLAVSLPAGAVLRATYTIAHVLDGASDTIPVADREAVASWAAALLLDQLASLFAGDSDSSIGADAVEHRSKAQEYASRARTLRARYFDALGIDPKKTVAAGVEVNLTLPDSRGRDRLLKTGALR
jgi:hypothetical protein